MSQSGNNTKNDKNNEGQTIPARSGAEAVIGTDVQALLGEKIREIYQRLVNDPVPDKFIHLLAELESKEKKG